MSQQFVVQLPNRPGELAPSRQGPVRARRQHRPGPPEPPPATSACAEIYTDCCDDDTREVLHSMGYPFVAGIEP